MPDQEPLPELLPEATGPYTVEARLLYETISVRTINQLFQIQTPEIAAFRNYYLAADRAPVVVQQFRRQRQSPR